MSRTVTDSRQIVKRGTRLDQIAGKTHYDATSDSKPASTSELDNLLDALNQDLTSPLRLSASDTPDLVVSVGAAIVSTSETNRQRSIPHVGALLPNTFTSGTITFPSASGGTITVSPGNNGILTVSASNFIKVLIYMTSDGNLNVLSGTENATESLATVNPAPSGTLPIGYVTLQNVAGTIQNIAQNKIYQFVGSSAASSGTGGGTDVPAPGYRWKESDSFTDLSSSSDSKVLTTAGYTRATQSISKALYQVSVDKSKTVAAGSTGTTLNISSAPSFTVQTGDIAYIQKYRRRVVAVGQNTNTLAYSDDDGLTWTGIGTAIFSSSGDGVAWNNTRFVAVGSGTNSIAYSSNGVSWTGIGTAIFSTSGKGICWNGSIFVAVGSGTNSIAYSSDGITWTGLGTAIFSTSGLGVTWNGTRFVAVGQGTNTIAYSNDGINWTGLGTSIFSTFGQAVAWNGSIFVAGGSGTNGSAYSSDGITWTGNGSSPMGTVRGIAWDGLKFIAVGVSGISRSVDGINWTSNDATVISDGYSVAWNGNRMIAGGSGTNTLAYSTDGVTWTGLGATIFGAAGAGAGIACSPSPNLYPAVNTLVQIETSAGAGQWRRISTVGSQTSFTLDSAFTGGDASTGDRVMISQALWTKDLVNLGSSTERTRARDFFSGNILTAFIDYQDSLTASDDVSDRTLLNRMVVAASNTGLATDTSNPTSNTFGSIFARPIRANTVSDYTLFTNSTQERLFLVFFADPYNPDVTSTANILDYEASFYGDNSTVNSGVLEDAICFSDNSTTPHNCTVATASGITSVTLDWSFVPNVKTGESQVEVYVDGKRINKFISIQKTPSTDLYFTEQTDGFGIYRKIQFNNDLSVTPVEIKVIKRLGVNVDVAVPTVNRVNALADFVVGSAAQVANGTATHTTLTDAITAAVAGQSILVLNNVSITDTVTVNKKLHIAGKGNGSSVTGSLTVTSAGAKSSFDMLRFSSSITFQASADYCFGRLWQANGQTFSNDPSNTSSDISIIQE